MKAEEAAEDSAVANVPAQRLCNEIQLFDLCDLDSCTFKEGRFCTNCDLLTTFERISDVDEARPEMFGSEVPEEGEDAGCEEFDEDFADDGYGDEAEYEDE